MTSIHQAKVDEFFHELIEYSEGSKKQLDEAWINPDKRNEIHKKVSQLIASSWLADTEEGLEIRQALLWGNSDKIKEVFCKYGVELGHFEVKANWDSFYSWFDKAKDTINLPYPPRPMEVTDTQLREWRNNNDPNIIHPTAPYIPHCTV